MEDNAPRRFIFDDSFYNSLESENNIEPKKVNEPINIVKEDKVEENITQPIVEEKVSEIEIPTISESTIETVSTTIPEIEEEPITEEKIPEVIVELPKEEIPVEQEKVEDINTDIENENSFIDVSSGINKSLEQEILNSHKKIVEEYKFPTVEKVEIPAYRATRRHSEPTNNQMSFDNIKRVENIKEPEEKIDERWQPPYRPNPILITEQVKYYDLEDTSDAVKSTLLDDLRKKNDGKYSILTKYGDDFCSHEYITNPAIGRDEEIKNLELVLLTPEKSAILVGKPGIGKTSIVEGLAYRLQKNIVPDKLKGYTIISVKTVSLVGKAPDGETKLQTLVDELKGLDKIILFIDEVHMLIEATDDSNLDFANLFKESLGRGSIKIIGATTSEEYERYILRDKAFVRRFQRIDVSEPTKEETLEIVMGTIPKMEKVNNAKLKYTYYIQTEIVKFIIDITSEYKRVYGLGSRYPDVALTLVNQAFSQAVFNNRQEVNIIDFRNAILKSKNIYPDVIKKEIVNFDKQFKDLIDEETEN